MTTTTDALTDGRWVMRPGGLRVWQPAPHRTPPTTAERAAETILATLTAIAAPTPPRITGTTCPDCGCLLRNDTELCPACVIPWCRDAERRHTLNSMRTWPW